MKPTTKIVHIQQDVILNNVLKILCEDGSLWELRYTFRTEGKREFCSKIWKQIVEPFCNGNQEAI